MAISRLTYTFLYIILYSIIFWCDISLQLVYTINNFIYAAKNWSIERKKKVNCMIALRMEVWEMNFEPIFSIKLDRRKKGKIKSISNIIFVRPSNTITSHRWSFVQIHKKKYYYLYFKNKKRGGAFMAKHILTRHDWLLPQI